MRTKKRPEPLGQRGRAKQRNEKYFNQPNITMSKNNFHQKNITASILAMVGLGFYKDREFSRLVKIGGLHGR